MIRRTFRGLIHLLAGLGASIAIIAILLAWRLSAGPISLGFLSPYLEDGLNDPEAPLRIQIGDTILAWAGWDRTLDVRVIDTRMVNRDGDVVANIPELSVSFKASALLRGQVVPREVEILRPLLRLTRTEAGGWGIGFEDGETGTPLTSLSAGVKALALLPSIKLTEARVRLADPTRGWALELPASHVEIHRKGRSFEGIADLRLPAGRSSARLVLAAHYRLDDERVTVSARASDLDVLGLARILPWLEGLERLDAVMDGNASAVFDTFGQVVELDASFKAKSAALSLSAPLAGVLDVSDLELHGGLDGNGQWRGEVVARVGADNARGGADKDGGREEGAPVTVAVALSKDRSRLDLGIDLAGVSPAALAALQPLGTHLEGMALPVRGTATVSLAIDGTLVAANLDLTAGAGRLTLPAPFGQDLPVRAGVFQGAVDGTANRLTVERLVVELESHGELKLPTGSRHGFPLRRLELAGNAEPRLGKFHVKSLTADLGGPVLSMSGRGTRVGSESRMVLDAKLTDLEVDSISRFWPRDWGVNPRQWALDHVSDGTVSQIAARVALRMDADGTTVVEDVNGTMRAEGVTVDYLPPMLPLVNGRGRAHFDLDTFILDVEHGETGDLRVRQGRVSFTGLSGSQELAEIALTIDGPFRQAVALIDQEPLGFAAVLGMRPDNIDGLATTRLKLGFLTSRHLTLEEIDIQAEAELRDVSIRDAVLRLDISEGNLALKVDNAGMNVDGHIRLGSIPGTLSWRENFDKGAAFRSRYHIVGQVNDRQRMEELPLNFPPFSNDMLRGPTDAKVIYTVFDDGRSRLNAQVDLTQAELEYSVLQWRKSPGLAGSGTVTVDLVNDEVASVPHFAVLAQDLDLRGGVTFPADGGSRIALEKLTFGRSDVEGLLIQRNGAWDADFKGASLDMSSILHEALGGEAPKAPSSEGTGGGRKAEKGPPVSLSVNLQQVWLSNDRQLSNVAGALVHDGEKWTQIQLQGLFQEGRAFHVGLATADAGGRKITVQSDDAGAALRGLGIYDNMVGGTLTLTGEFNDAEPGSPLGGRLRVRDYKIVKAPVLVQLLSVMALTGVLEVLQGEGLVFSVLDTPFQLNDHVLRISDARGSGTSLGFTASGAVNTATDTLDLAGTVVPAYGINSMLGRLPLVGELFTGGEKGSGVFAATYAMRGPMSQPLVTVNPLSVLAPGFLRNLFGKFDSEPSTSELPPAPDDPEPDATTSP